MKKTFTLLCFALLIPFFALSQSNFHNTHYLDPYNPEYVKGEVLIKFKDEAKVNKSIKSGIAKTGITSVDQLLMAYQTESIEKVFKETREQRRKKSIRTIRDFKGKEIEVPALYNIYKLTFDTIWDANQLVEELQKDENIDFVELNYLIYSMDMTPNDPLYSTDMWYIDTINAPAAWDLATGNGQIIGILDTGVDDEHPDLDDNIWTNSGEVPDNGMDDDANGYVDDIHGWDYINNDNDPNDDNSHGTHVAGIAAAEGNNGIGIIGLAYEAKIMPLKVLQSSGSGNSSDLAEAIEYAYENGATVINMSLGSYGESLTVKSALEVAYSYSFPVASAGNDNLSIDAASKMYPACYSFVVGVQASSQNGSKANFSNYDPSGPVESPYEELYNYEVMAPGVTIISTFPNGGYHNLNGTSMASPIVAGTIALMQEYMPAQSKEEVFAKLIQSSDGGIIDVPQALDYVLVPDLYFMNYTMLDTCASCDNDGIPDAGETIDLYLSVKNAGGFADSVWSKIRFATYEDTTVATIIDSISYIGNISAYANLTGELDHFQVHIDPASINNRDIVFEYEIGCKNSAETASGEIIQTVQNGAELLGIMDSTLILTPDKLWIVNGSFLVNGTLILNPGTKLVLHDANAYFGPYGKMYCNGTKDSLVELVTLHGAMFQNIDTLSCVYTKITFPPPPSGNNSRTIFYDGGIMDFDHCIFENVNSNWDDYDDIQYCHNTHSQMFNSNIGTSINKYNNYDFYSGTPSRGTRPTKFCNLYWCGGGGGPASGYEYNNILSQCLVTAQESHSCPNVFWGTTNTTLLDERVIDFWDNATYGFLDYDPILQKPSDSAHGCVWKVEIDGIDPQDEVLDPLGTGTYQFDVYFNKCMDTTFTPFLTFGVAEPYTQKIVYENASWSADSTIWTAYYNIGAVTGDGLNQIRVADAIDTAGFVIPIEYFRFKFSIQAAAAASVEFYALAGIGKVDLEWPPTPTDDALGYNLYRYYNITDSTFTSPVRINTDLIIDTVYTDYNVVPDTTYHYMYKTLGTDMEETDYSKVATAIPFNAANGDANGDLGVDVMDITTIVSYMLNQDPSPFLFDAADVNYDNDINVLDIIALVQLINGKKSLSILPLPEFSKETAYYLMKDNKMQFESMGNVAAMQFKIKDKRGKIKELEELKIFSLSYGFEFAYTVVDDHIIGILFSLSGKEIPVGNIDLFRFEGSNTNAIEFTEIFGGDLSGNYVPVLKKGENTSILASEAELQVNPNPFSYSTQINYLVPENALVNLRIFDLTGKEIKSLTNAYHQSGNHTTNWNGTNSEGQLLKSGIYLLQLKIKSASGNTYNKEVKVVLTK